jgi:hypothetical protein
MKALPKVLLTLTAVAALSIVYPTSVQAVPTTYQYTGNPFTYVNGVYTTSDFVTVMFRLAGPLAPNMPITAITPIALTVSCTHNELAVAAMCVHNQDRLPFKSTAELRSASTQVRGQDAVSAASASGKIWNTSSRRELFKTSRTVSCNPASKNFPP